MGRFGVSVGVGTACYFSLVAQSANEIDSMLVKHKSPLSMPIDVKSKHRVQSFGCEEITKHDSTKATVTLPFVSAYRPI
jgi:hypothetical protein